MQLERLNKDFVSRGFSLSSYKVTIVCMDNYYYYCRKDNFATFPRSYLWPLVIVSNCGDEGGPGDRQELAYALHTTSDRAEDFKI